MVMSSSRKLTYKKDSGTQELEPLRHVDSDWTDYVLGDDVMTSGVPSMYSKSDGTLPYELVFVISGGTKRERDFLKVLINGTGPSSLRVIFLSKEGQGLNPNQMQERWKDIRTSGIVETDIQKFQLDVMDKIFLLTDVDEFYDQLVDILREKAEGDNGEWVISNPCFEIWLYYCYLNNPEEDLAVLKELPRAKRGQTMKSLGDTLISGGLNSIRAFEQMHDGIKNSASHYTLDENGIPVLFATQMHLMARYLVDTLNSNASEYDDYIRNKREFREHMKRSEK